MRTVFTLLLTIIGNLVMMAQTPDKALARVRYSFTHLRDTTVREKPYTENMLLVIGKSASVYTSYDKLNRDIETKKNLMEQIKSQAGSGKMSININKTSNRNYSETDYFYFAKENKFYSKERLFNNYLIEEDPPQINWKITKDTANFSGVKCQKAVARFKGRNWIAWYAPELPFQSGPWKLNGLPGLIIEAYDDKKEVLFQFAGIDNVNEEEVKAMEKELTTQSPTGGGEVKLFGMDGGSSYLGMEIKLPTDAIKTTRKELDKLKEARDKDPQGFLNAQIAGSGMQIGPSPKVNFSAISGGSSRASNIVNNPIELPEKK
jgi:GLPGLI family protein